MYKLCKTEQSAQRQRMLEEGLLNAMLNQRYEDISISDLCDQMGIPRKSFYRYFASKDGALHALIDHRLMEYETRKGPTKLGGRNGVYLDIPWFFEFWLTQKPLLDALARSGLSGILVTRSIAYSQQEQLMDFGSRQYTYDKEYHNNAIAFAVCGLMTLVIQWHRDGYRQTPQEMAEMTHKILSRPLIADI